MKARFNYPPQFTTLPEYTAHAGQIVTVGMVLEDTEGQEDAGCEPLFWVVADDGWFGQAFESELAVQA